MKQLELFATWRSRGGVMACVAAALALLCGAGCGDERGVRPPPVTLFEPSPAPTAAARVGAAPAEAAAGDERRPALPVDEAAEGAAEGAAAGAAVGAAAGTAAGGAEGAIDVGDEDTVGGADVAAIGRGADAAAAADAASATRAALAAAAWQTVARLWRDCPRAGQDAARCATPDRPAAERVRVAAILVAWRGAVPDPRVERDPEAADRLSEALLQQARMRGADFFALMWRHSDDPSDGVYQLDATSAGRFATPLVERALRLGVGEIDRVRSRFGWHVVTRLPDGARTAPRPAVDLCAGPCPLSGEDPASCVRAPAVTPAEVEVDSILVSWRHTPGGAGVQRSRQDALALAIELCHAARARGAAFAALGARHSDDPGGGRYTVRADGGLAASFTRMALSLSVDNVAVTETPFGLHVLRRTR